MSSDDQSDQINELAAALAKAQGQMKPAKKDSTNPHFKSRYADLASIVEACREPLSSNGLAFMQRVSTTQESVCVVTHMVHSSGQWVKDKCELPVAQRTPQAYGSAITYARRYSLSALVGMAADEDDDGNAASAQTVQNVQNVQKPESPRLAQPIQPTELQKANMGNESVKLAIAKKREPGIFEKLQILATEHGIDGVRMATIIKDVTGKLNRAQLDEADYTKVNEELTKISSAKEKLTSIVGFQPQ